MKDFADKNMLSPEEVLIKYWNYDSFRPPQKGIINAVLEKKDSLAILPTGAGKSVCFQVPALILPGVCIVVSPLIALMKDQVNQLKTRNISAAAIFSGQDKNTNTQILNDAIDGKYKFLYVSPERLQTYDFMQAAQYLKIGLLAIDEAHCISKWGYDFRPSYLDIAGFKAEFSHQNFPTIALTATATNLVRKDISEKLKLRNPRIFVKSFARENLSYLVKHAEIKEKQILDFLKNNRGSSIVYAKTRKRTAEISNFLENNGLKADFYHAGLGIYERNKKQDEWLESKDAVMVATNAFGMGIDKPDVRNVIHADVCDNLEAYYQESGRAGRDQKPCKAILLYSNSDFEVLERNLNKKYPEKSLLIKVYQSLANYYQTYVGEVNFELKDFNLYDFVSTFGLSLTETHYALKILESENLIVLSDAYFQPSKIRFLAKSKVLDDFLKRNPSASDCVKAILRIYGGELFSSFMAIDEKEIVSASGSSYSKTIETINFLHKHQIVEYAAQKSSPQFSFQNFRYEASQIPIDYKALRERKSNDLKALKAMIGYAEQDEQCRMNYIQEYFDEKGPKPCGKCDVCLKSEYLSGTEIEEIKQKVYAQLPNTLIKLEVIFAESEKQTALAILKSDLKKGKLQMDSFGLIFVAN